MLEQHNHKSQRYNYLIGENGNLHLPIAEHFIAASDIGRAFAVIRSANDIDQARFLVGVMKQVCDLDKTLLTGMFINKDEVIWSLKQYATYRHDCRFN